MNKFVKKYLCDLQSCICVNGQTYHHTCFYMNYISKLRGANGEFLYRSAALQFVVVDDSSRTIKQGTIITHCHLSYFVNDRLDGHSYVVTYVETDGANTVIDLMLVQEESCYNAPPSWQYSLERG